MKLYQDKEWLYNKYVNEKLSQEWISKLCNVTQNAIWKWLRKHNIQSRSLSEANHLRQVNHCSLSKKAIEWINGELLGDGNLEKPSSYSVRFRYTSKYSEYIQYIMGIFNSFGMEQTKMNKYYHKKYDCYSYRYNSLSYPELLPMYEQWYPNGRKEIPKDIKLTPITLKQWYLGDGCLVHRKQGNPNIVLCTYGFLVSDVEWLMEQLRRIGFKITRWADNAIRVSAYSVKDFLKYIGNCPVQCYQYKFNY